MKSLFGTMPQIMLIYGTSLILPNTKETIGLVWGEGNFIIDSCWIMDCRVATKKVSALNSQSLCWNSAIKASPSERWKWKSIDDTLAPFSGWRWSVAMETECFSFLRHDAAQLDTQMKIDVFLHRHYRHGSSRQKINHLARQTALGVQELWLSREST